MALIDQLIKDGWLKTPKIIKAFRKIRREDFLSYEEAYEYGDIKNLAELNEPLPIGNGQTISQPLTVAFMLELLQPEPGNMVMDIGSGSGWTVALLANIVGKKGKVFGVEIIKELKELGERNVSKYNYIKKGIAKIICGDASNGYPGFASLTEVSDGFDRILASASANRIPLGWKRQLKVGGRMVVSVKDSIWLAEKKSETEFIETEYPGFVFVPLVSG